MSLRDKAREIREAGAEQRGNFTPHGKPKELYQYWLENSDSMKAANIRAGYQRENFCHYWRVVAFWAPGMKLVNKVGTKNLSIAALVLIAIAILGVLGWGLTMSEAREVILVILATLALIGVGIGAGAGIYEAGERWGSGGNKWLSNALKTVVSVFAAAAVVFLHYAFITDYGLLLGLAYLYGGAVGITLVPLLFVLAMIGVGNLISSLRALADKKMMERAEERALRSPAEREETEPREPGKVSKFFTAVGDFFVLISQVVRVNKWKICPLVDIDAKVDTQV